MDTDPFGPEGQESPSGPRLDATGERREANSLVNDIRREVDLWRARNYPGATPTKQSTTCMPTV